MLELKSITRDSIPRCLAKAERYRLLNEPREAESICRDVLRADPDNAEALVMLLLSLTDQFGEGFQVEIGPARQVLGKMRDPYEQAYYGGVIAERWAKAQLAKGNVGDVIYDWFCEAMSLYEKAEALRPAGNEDAVLRWNTCARIIMGNAKIRPRGAEVRSDTDFGD
jgi:hypothetical protein